MRPGAPVNAASAAFCSPKRTRLKHELTDELDSFVPAKVGRGRYGKAGEVVRAALRILEREEQQYEARLAALRKTIDEGDRNGSRRDILSTVSSRHWNSPESHTAPDWSPDPLDSRVGQLILDKVCVSLRQWSEGLSLGEVLT